MAQLLNGPKPHKHGSTMYLEIYFASLANINLAMFPVKNMHT